MEHQNINRVELQGFVGSCTATQIDGNRLVRFTVATNHTVSSGSDGVIIETTWHQCSAWNPVAEISKGTMVHLTGRIRNYRYTGSDGQERFSNEILVSTLETLKP